MKKQWVTIKEFADRIGKSYPWVYRKLQQGIKSGDITVKNKKIEWHQTKAWWDSHLQPKHAPGKYKRNQDSTNIREIAGRNAKNSETHSRESDIRPLSFIDRKDKADAEKKELEVAKLKGQLLDKATVVKTVFEFARNAREQLRGLPKRWAGTFATETDQRVIQDIMEREIEAALQGLEEVKL